MQVYYIENAFWHSDTTEDLKHSLMAAARDQGITLVPRTNADFINTKSLEEGPRAALFWDKDIRLAMAMEQAGMRLFNQAWSIEVCDDKTLTWLALKDTDLPMPDTLLVPSTFPSVGYPEGDFLEEATQLLGLPMVIKEGRGSFGQQVYLARTLAEAKDILNCSPRGTLLLQRFISESAGRDVRTYVVGGRVVASILRRSHTGDFRANVTSGGTATAYRLSEEEEKLALAACRRLKLDFAGVDLLLAKDGPLLCEVNSNAHFIALREATGQNPAKHILAHLREALP